MPGTITDLVALGGDALVTMMPAGADEPLAFIVSLHVARRNRVATGETVSVSLLAGGIHLMERQS